MLCSYTNTDIFAQSSYQGCSQDFLKGGSSISIELIKAGVWRPSPQPLGEFQYLIVSKLSKLLYFVQKSEENTYYNGEAQVCSSW